MAAPSIEARVAALEEALARQLYGGTAEEAMKKWHEDHLAAGSAAAAGPQPPAKPEHPAGTKNKVK